MGSIRLFAGITPPQPVRDHLDIALEDVRARAGEQLRWTPRANWHITLSFYGEQPAGSIEEISDYLRSVAESTSPMSIHLAGAGSFHSTRLWIGVGGETDRLRGLMSECLLDAELPRRNRAHLSVATLSGSHSPQRWRGQRPSPVVGNSTPRLDNFVHALSVYAGPEFDVDAIELFESRLGEGPGGAPAYDVLARFPFGAAST